MWTAVGQATRTSPAPAEALEYEVCDFGPDECVHDEGGRGEAGD